METKVTVAQVSTSDTGCVHPTCQLYHAPPIYIAILTCMIIHKYFYNLFVVFFPFYPRMFYKTEMFNSTHNNWQSENSIFIKWENTADLVTQVQVFFSITSYPFREVFCVLCRKIYFTFPKQRKDTLKIEWQTTVKPKQIQLPDLNLESLPAVLGPS